MGPACPTWAFGRQFQDGVSIKPLEGGESSMGLLIGVFGAAFNATIEHVKNETEEMDLELSMWGCTMLVGLKELGTAASLYTSFLMVQTVAMQVSIIIILRIVSCSRTRAH